MKLGVFLPVSGRAAVPEVLTDAARQAERLGFDSVWAAERLVNPWTMNTRYPYKANDQWFVPPESPFLETLTVLTYLAGVTDEDFARCGRHRPAVSPSAVHRACRDLDRHALEGPAHPRRRHRLDARGVRGAGRDVQGPRRHVRGAAPDLQPALAEDRPQLRGALLPVRAGRGQPEARPAAALPDLDRRRERGRPATRGAVRATPGSRTS